MNGTPWKPSEFELPRADVRGVVEDVLELVEVHERAFDFVELDFLEGAAARNFPDKARQLAAAVRASRVSQTAVNVVARAVAQHHGPARIKWREHNLAGLAVRHWLAGLWIHDFHDPEVGIEMVAGRRLVHGHGAFGEGHLRLGEAVGRHHVELSRAEFEGEVAELEPHAVGHLLAAEHDAMEVFATHAFVRGLVQDVINKGRHADEHVRANLAEETKLALGAHDLAAAGAGGEYAEARAAVVREPERQVRRVREHIQQLVLASRAAHAEDALAGELEIREVVVRVEEGHRVGAAARGAGEKDGAELIFKTIRHGFAPMQQRAKNAGRPAGQHVAIRHEQEVAGLLRIIRGVEQVGLAREGQAAQVVKRAEVVGGELELAEQLAVVR